VSPAQQPPDHVIHYAFENPDAFGFEQHEDLELVGETFGESPRS